MKFILLALCLHKSYIREHSGSWILVQNAPSQSDCMILKSAAISPENSDEFDSCRYRFKKGVLYSCKGTHRAGFFSVQYKNSLK